MVLVVLILLLIFTILFCLYQVISFILDITGAPFVPTSSRVVDEILAGAFLKKGQLFIELGSGDGRVIRKAVQKYDVKGLGVEMNPFLLLFSKILARLQVLNNIQFVRENMYRVNLAEADVIFCFLLPRSMKKLAVNFLGDCMRGTLIISHGFKIPEWEKRLIKKIDRKHFPTYYYRV